MSRNASATGGGPRPAATVVVLRDGARSPEVFMVRRGEGMAFMAGAHVFPGGRVEEADRDADARWCDGAADASRVAAARELFEEAGVLLARDEARRFVSLAGPEVHERFKQHRSEVHAGVRTFRAVIEREGLRLALDALVPFAHWVTPPIDVRRFDTRFFVARVPPEQTPAHDAAEAIDSAWWTPVEALERGRRDEIVLPPPTWTTLREIERFGSVDEVIAWARARRIVRREPRFVEQDGVKMLLIDDPSVADRRFVLTNGRWRAEGTRT